MSRSFAAAGNSTFPFLGGKELAAYGLLGTPLYIYSFATQRICWSNAGALRFWNAASAEELHARELTPYSPSTQVRLADYLDAFRRGEDRVESWTFYPKGEAAPALCRCSGVSLQGHPQAMLVEVQALTPVDLPVEELRALEALRHTPLKVSLLSASGEVLIRNPAAMAVFAEMDARLPAGADHFRAMFADPADADLLLAEANRLCVARRPASIAVRDGSTHAVEVSMVTDPATGESALLVAQSDISELVQVGRQLAASEDALDSVLSLNVAPVLVLSAAEGTVLRANYMADMLLGGESSTGVCVDQLFSEPGMFDTFRAAVLAGGSANTQARLHLANGGTFWASVSGARIMYQKQDAIVVMVTDIDRLYRAAADLEAALDSEREASAMQRRFLSIAAHEFRTPLAIIDGAAQRIEHTPEAMTPEQLRGRAIRIRKTVKRLLLLLENTVETARKDQGTMGYRPVPGDLEHLLRQVADTFVENNPGTRIDLNIPQLPELHFDANLMEQAFGNLFSNAIKYSDGPAQIEVSARTTSEDVQFVVRDYGIGIPADERERVFSDYVRGSNAGGRQGTGLGLSIVRQIFGLHGGLIECVDTEPPGATFHIVLPRP